MYYLSVEEKISSAHQLRGYKGRCENLHGHNWKIILTVKGETLNGIGLLIDFHDLKPMLKETLAAIDHTCINEHPWFAERNPSSENISRFIHEQIAAMLDAKGYTGVCIDSVTVYESESSWCTYRI